MGSYSRLEKWKSKTNHNGVGTAGHGLVRTDTDEWGRVGVSGNSIWQSSMGGDFRVQSSDLRFQRFLWGVIFRSVD